MRQRDDSQFAQLLCRVRTATCTDEDIKVLESRVITDDHPGYPHEAIKLTQEDSSVNYILLLVPR